MRRRNGSIQSANTPVYNKVGIKQDDQNKYRCMVTAVKYVDDPNNITQNSQNPEVLYDVVVLGGFRSGQTLTNARLSPRLGGNTNFEERTLRPASSKVTGTRLSQQDGDIVYVEFNQGHSDYPIITGFAKGISNTVAATSSIGPRTIESYNGVQTEINNKGEYIVTQFGGSVDSSKQAFIPSTSPQTTLKIDKDGIITVTSKTAVVTIDSTANKISIAAGSTEIDIDGGSGKISLKGADIDLGSSTSDFVTMFTALLSAFNSHTHLVPQAPAGTLPSQPPMLPLPQSVGSQTVKVQS